MGHARLRRPPHPRQPREPRPRPPPPDRLDRRPRPHARSERPARGRRAPPAPPASDGTRARPHPSARPSARALDLGRRSVAASRRGCEIRRSPASQNDAHGRRPPLHPALRGRDAVRVQITSDLAEALASAVLSRDTPHDVVRQHRPAADGRRLRIVGAGRRCSARVARVRQRARVACPTASRPSRSAGAPVGRRSRESCRARGRLCPRVGETLDTLCLASRRRRDAVARDLGLALAFRQRARLRVRSADRRGAWLSRSCGGDVGATSVHRTPTRGRFAL